MKEYTENINSVETCNLLPRKSNAVGLKAFLSEGKY
jgi:hypothetical protein